MAACIPGLRFYPVGVVVNSKKIRVIHDITFAASNNRKCEQSDGFEKAPPCVMGHVLHQTVFRSQALRRAFGLTAGILRSKMTNVNDAFRQIPVNASSASTFGYSTSAFGLA